MDCYDAIEYVSAVDNSACKLLGDTARKVADLWNDPPRGAMQRDIVRDVFEELADALDELLGGGPVSWTDPYREQRIETTRRNLDDARKAGDQKWIAAEQAILESLQREAGEVRR